MIAPNLLFKRIIEITHGYKLQNLMFHSVLCQRSERATGDAAHNSPVAKSMQSTSNFYKQIVLFAWSPVN